MTPAEARRYVLMDMLDHAANRSAAWQEAAARNAKAQPVAAEWDATRERLLVAITKHDATQESLA